MGNSVVKTWTVPANAVDDRTHKVQLTHHNFSGERSLTVDGVETYKATQFIDTGDDIRVQIGEKSGMLRIRTSELMFEYTFSFDGKQYTDDMQLLNTDGKLDELMAHMTCSVYTTTVDAAGVVWYHIKYDLENGNPRVAQKRYSALFALYEKVESAYVDTHLSENLPAFPPRSLKLFQDHKAREFREERRIAIDTWLNKLVKVPRIGMNIDLQMFFVPDSTERATIFDN